MKTQYDQILVSSFYLWLEDTLIRHGEAFRADTQTFTYAQTNDRPQGYVSYFSAGRQFVANGADVPNYVSINGNTVSQNTTGTTKLLIDYDKGRVLVSSNVGTSATITGGFAKKEINTYLINDTQDNLIINSEFVVGGEPYLKTTNAMGEARYTLPAVFITNENSSNDPYAIGGLDNTKNRISTMIVATSMYDAEACSSLFRDCARRSFKQIPYEAFPYGRWGTLKSHPYTYTGLASESGYGCVSVDGVNVYRFSDVVKSKLPRDLQVRFAEFDVSSARMSRSQFV
jgi:hypothetical protein